MLSIDRYQLEKSNSYAIAKITGTGMGKSGRSYSIAYLVDSIWYKGGFNPTWAFRLQPGDYLFVKIVADDPDTFVQTDYVVPSCLLGEAEQGKVYHEIEKEYKHLCE